MIFESFWEIFGKYWKCSETIGKFAVIGKVRKHSQKLKGIAASFEKFSKGKLSEAIQNVLTHSDFF